MSKISEKFEKEILRMLYLSEFNKPKKEILLNKSLNNGAEFLKEDFGDDLGDIFGNEDEFLNFNTNGSKSTLTNEMKAAMLVGSLSEFQTAALKLYNDYHPRNYSNYTKGTKVEDDPNALSDKQSTKKIKGSEEDLARWKLSGPQNDELGHEKGKRYDKEFEEFQKLWRVPITFIGSEVNLDNLIAAVSGYIQKWGGNKKSFSMISWIPTKNVGKYNSQIGGLTDLGKAQLEFLARAASLKPIDEFEAKLFKVLGEVKGESHMVQTAQDVIRQFYTLVMEPRVAELLKRPNRSTRDSQVTEWVETAINHALDQLPSKYDPKRGNLGSFIITTVTNKVINQLRGVSDQVLDTEAIDNIIYNYNGKDPIVIQSTANPKDINFESTDDRYVAGPFMVDGAGGKKTQIWNYNYKNTTELYNDLINKGNKTGEISPLAKEFLTAKSKEMFYKSVPKARYQDVEDILNYKNTENPENWAIFKVEQLPEESKNIIYGILNDIANIIITDDTNYAPKKDRNIYAIDDKNDYNPDMGYLGGSNKLKYPALRDKPYKTKEDLATINQDNNKKILVNFLYELLNYGDLILVYTVSWIIKNKEGKTTTIPPGRPVEYNDDGTEVPNIKGRTPENYETKFIWSTGEVGGNKTKMKGNFIGRFLEKAQKLNLKSSPGTESLIEKLSNPKTATSYSSAILGALQKIFNTDDRIKKNTDKLKALLQNYSNSTLAENKMRNVIKNLLINQIKNKQK